MLGERSDQRGLWEVDRLYLDHVGRDTFYGLMASLRGRLFRAADFGAFYCLDNGRDSVPPSLLATALLLQSHDAEVRADFDIRWKVVLGIEVEGGGRCWLVLQFALPLMQWCLSNSTIPYPLEWWENFTHVAKTVRNAGVWTQVNGAYVVAGCCPSTSTRP